MQEIGGYAIPEAEAEKFSEIRKKADALDYDGILQLLTEQGRKVYG